jgi:hypothetical protein
MKITSEDKTLLLEHAKEIFPSINLEFNQFSNKLKKISKNSNLRQGVDNFINFLKAGTFFKAWLKFYNHKADELFKELGLQDSLTKKSE